jgi:cytochrome c
MLGRCLLIAFAACAPMAQAYEFFTLKGHGGPVMDIAVSARSGQVATASFDNSVGLWKTQKPEWLEGHRAAVNAVAFVDEARLVSAGDNFTLIDWDLSTRKGALRGTHQARITALAVSPSGGLVASASWDGSIGLWADDGSPPRFLSGHKAGVNTVAFNSDGTRRVDITIGAPWRDFSLERRPILAMADVALQHQLAVGEVKASSC